MHAIHDEPIAVKIGFEHGSGYSPNPFIILLHRHRLSAFQVEQHLFRIRRAQAEGDRVISVYLG